MSRTCTLQHMLQAHYSAYILIVVHSIAGFLLLYNFVVVAEYHLFSAPLFVTVVSYMPSLSDLLKSWLVKPTDGSSVFASRKEKVGKAESV